jgi:hypothetical protein
MDGGNQYFKNNNSHSKVPIVPHIKIWKSDEK